MKGGIDGFDVFHSQGSSKHALVEGHGKARVDELAVKEGHGHEASYEPKVEPEKQCKD